VRSPAGKTLAWLPNRQPEPTECGLTPWLRTEGGNIASELGYQAEEDCLDLPLQGAVWGEPVALPDVAPSDEIAPP